MRTSNRGWAAYCAGCCQVLCPAPPGPWAAAASSPMPQYLRFGIPSHKARRALSDKNPPLLENAQGLALSSVYIPVLQSALPVPEFFSFSLCRRFLSSFCHANLLRSHPIFHTLPGVQPCFPSLLILMGQWLSLRSMVSSIFRRPGSSIRLLLFIRFLSQRVSPHFCPICRAQRSSLRPFHMLQSKLKSFFVLKFRCTARRTKGLSALSLA